MAKTKNSSWTSHVLYGLIIFALVLGSVNLQVSAENADRVIQEQSLEIDGGESRHFIIDASETLTFKLELKQPIPGVHYIWEIQQLATAGMASVEIFDEWAMVTYLPSQGFSGEDHFLVGVTDGKGGTGQVHVSVSVVPILSEPGSPEPIHEDSLNPGLERMPSLDPLHSSTKQDMLFRSNEIPETRRTPLQPDSDWIDDFIYTETRTPSIVVDLFSWEIYGFWGSGSTITLTIDDPNNGVGIDYTETGTPDEMGWIAFYPDFWLLPGQLVTLTDGIVSTTHTIIDLQVTGFNEADDTLTGLANPGLLSLSSEYVDEFGGDIEEVTTTANSEGVWQATFDKVELEPGKYGWISQSDIEGNSTNNWWQIPNPCIDVFPEQDEIRGSLWFPLTMVELRIDEVITASAMTDEWGVVYFDNLPDVKPGQTVVMTDGTFTRTHTVTDVAITEIDIEDNALRGTADAGSVIWLDAYDGFNLDVLEVTTDQLGVWEAQFTQVVLMPGVDGAVSQSDEQGNSTVIFWRIPDPYINVYPLGDYVYGYRWNPSTQITLKIDSTTWTATSNTDGRVFFNLLPFDLQSGQVVQMTDGTVTRMHTVTAVAVTEIDQTADIVYGTAVPGSELSTYANDGTQNKWFYPTADGSGDWSANFSGFINIEPGVYGWVYQYDEQGNSTRIRWNISNPSMAVYPLENSIYGEDWTPNTEVTITIDSNTWTAISDSSGWFYKSLAPFDIEPTKVVLITDGISTRTHTVSTVAVTDIDQALDIVYGTASPGSELSTFADDGTQNKWLYPTADGSGDWSANFSGLINIEPGVYGYVYQYDEQGNSTRIKWNIPNPRMAVYPQFNEFRGYEWAPDTEVTITIEGRSWTTITYSDGYFIVNIPFDVLPGQEVYMTDGTDAITYIITDVAVTDINQETEIVSGTADPGSEIFIEAHNYIAGDHATFDLITSTSGIWSANFSGLVDIAPSVWGMVFQNDENNNATAVRWNVPNPIIEVYPQRDSISGFEWSLDTTVTLTIGANSWSETSNASGHVYFDDLPINIVPGMIVSMTDGTYTRTHTVRNITVTEVNAETDLMRGTAQANSEVIVATGIGDMMYNFVIQVDSTGHWLLDFEEYGHDITPDNFGNIFQLDDEKNMTVIDYYVPNPYISVYPLEDLVIGYRWNPDVNVTMTIAGQNWTGKSNYNGAIRFETGSFDIQADHEIEMTDGILSRTYIIKDLAVTGFDEVAETVNGTADIGSDLSVSACDGINCATVYPIVGSDRSWLADFSGSVDICPGTYGYAYQYDIIGNSTRLYWFVPDPYFVVDPLEDVVYGYGWPANTPVTLEIGGETMPTTSLLSNRATWTEESDYQGFVEFKLDTYDIQAGEVVTMSGGTYTQTHTVAALEITAIDEAADKITGTAEAGSTVEVYAKKWSDSDLLSVVADGDGIWIAEFDGLVDIGPGASGFARQYDELENATIINWSIEGDYMIFLPLILK